MSADYRREQVLADRRSRLDRLEAENQRLAGLLERTLAAVEQAAAALERLAPSHAHTTATPAAPGDQRGQEVAMPAITVKIGTRERLEPGILKGTPLGALSTEALVRVGSTTIQGRAAALRALADACEEAASMAEEYDRDPAAYEEREEATRAAEE